MLAIGSCVLKTQLDISQWANLHGKGAVDGKKSG